MPSWLFARQTYATCKGAPQIQLILVKPCGSRGARSTKTFGLTLNTTNATHCDCGALWRQRQFGAPHKLDWNYANSVRRLAGWWACSIALRGPESQCKEKEFSPHSSSSSSRGASRAHSRWHTGSVREGHKYKLGLHENETLHRHRASARVGAVDKLQGRRRPNIIGNLSLSGWLAGDVRAKERTAKRTTAKPLPRAPAIVCRFR